MIPAQDASPLPAILQFMVYKTHANAAKDHPLHPMPAAPGGKPGQAKPGNGGKGLACPLAVRERVRPDRGDERPANG